MSFWGRGEGAEVTERWEGVMTEASTELTRSERALSPTGLTWQALRRLGLIGDE